MQNQTALQNRLKKLHYRTNTRNHSTKKKPKNICQEVRTRDAQKNILPGEGKLKEKKSNIRNKRNKPTATSLLHGACDVHEITMINST